MSQYLIYVNLPIYLSQWVTNRLGNPVVFPAGSPQNAVIRTYTRKRRNDEAVELPAPSQTAIAIPASAAKPPEIYNFIGKIGKEAVAESIKDLFLRELWCDISPLKNTSVKLNKLIAAWCEQHGIDIDRVETVRQCYYRIRKSYAAAGINLKKFNGI